MESLLALAFLACPIGMGLMMWFMAKGMGGQREPQSGTTGPSLDDLRAEHERLGRQIEQLEDAPQSPTPLEVAR